MELSKDAVKLLRWLEQNDSWKYRSEIEQLYKHFDYRAFNALEAVNLIDSCVFGEEIPTYDEYGDIYYEKHYRISDLGKAHLESISARRWPELREWISIAISIIALVVSIIALAL